MTTNLINGKKYIGQKKFDKKWINYIGSGVYFKNAIKKYGKENFSREIIAIAYSRKELDGLEKEFIKFHNATESDNFYNIADGGHNGNTFAGKTEEEMNGISKKISDSKVGKNLSEDTCTKISEALKGHIPWNIGITPSEETKQKISKSNIGKKLTEEQKIKVSMSKIGKPRSKDTKEKISQTLKLLTDEQVNEIRQKYKTQKISQYKLAQEYSVTQPTIFNVINYKGAYTKTS